MALDAGSCLSLALTRNRFAAAPVQWCRRNLAQHRPAEPSYALINAGNANAGTGERGLQDIERIHQELHGRLGLAPHQFLPFSTGVIGEFLPVDKLLAQLPALLDALDDSADAWRQAAQAIMTTDTVAKIASAQLEAGARGEPPIRLCAIAKGSGMIHPDMATMLCFLACDAKLEAAWLDRVATEALAQSFNCISVDGDTSTNDACLSIATGRGAVPDEAGKRALAETIAGLMETLANQIVADGEGASVVFEIAVSGARGNSDALAIARSVATSPLVKTAIGARDPNWGRILAAVGRAPVEALDIERVAILINGLVIVERGQRAEGYSEKAGLEAMRREGIRIDIRLGEGEGSGRCRSCDLTAEYVRINRDYRS